MPDDEELQKLLEKLRSQTQLLETQTAALNAEKARLEASLGLAKLTDPTQAAINRANADKAIAETARDTYRALLPQATALAGTVTMDTNVKLEAQILAYGELSGIATSIAEAITSDCHAASVIVCTQQEIDALLAYRQFLAQGALVEQGYHDLDPGQKRQDLSKTKDPTTQSLIGPAVAGLPAIAAASAAFDALGLLRENVATTGVEVTVPDFALVACVADALRKTNVALSYPNLLPVSGKAESALIGRLASLADLRRTVHERLAALDQKDPVVAAKQALRAKVDDAYTALLTALATRDEKTGAGLLALLLRAEMFGDQLTETARLLFLRGLSAGGTNRATQSLLPWRSRSSHSGGAIVGFVVLDWKANVLSSGVRAGHSGYQHQSNEGDWLPKTLAPRQG